MKYPLLIILSLLMHSLAIGQNLVPNPSFEAYDNCPTTHGQIKYLQYPFPSPPTVKEWLSPIPNSPDYFNACTNNIWIDVPKNYYGNYPARTGDGYTGIILFTGSSIVNPTVNSEYIECKLKSPLVAGATYNVSCYVKIVLSHETSLTAVMAADRISFAITDTYLSSYTSPLVANATPMYNSTKTILDDSTAWTKISNVYVAKGGEQYLTLGYFNSGASTNFKQIHPAPDLPKTSVTSYYAIEDVSVVGRPPCDTSTHIFNSTVCDPKDLPKTLNATATGTGYNYIWNTGANNSSISINEIGTYWCVATRDCDIITDSFHILPIQDTVVNVNNISTCHIDTIELDSKDNAISYIWNTGAATQKIKITMPGRYTCTSVKGCKAYFDVNNITLINDEFEYRQMDDTLLCKGSTYTLGVEYLDDVNITYQWNTSDSTCCITPTNSGNYILTINTECNSFKDTASIQFENCENCLFVPNAFTPNGDGLNDTYGIRANCRIDQFRLRIYNRWGQVAFETTDINARWDGLIRADFAEQSTYFYFVEYTTPQQT